MTRHALDVAEARRIPFEWIERTARDPEWIEEDATRPGIQRRFRAISEFGGRVLRVACLETEDELRILTAFFDRDARSQA